MRVTRQKHRVSRMALRWMAPTELDEVGKGMASKSMPGARWGDAACCLGRVAGRLISDFKLKQTKSQGKKTWIHSAHSGGKSSMRGKAKPLPEVFRASLLVV